jgi:hypothetical protein
VQGPTGPTGAASTAAGPTGAGGPTGPTGATPAIGGSNTQVQYNNGGSLAGSANFVFDGTNVGIGTPTPGVKLEVVQNQATYSYFDFYNTTANGGINFRQIYRNIANTGNATIDFAKLIGGGFALNNTDTNAANFTSFGVGASERMRLNSSGNLGVGTSSPNYKIEGNGVIASYVPSVGQAGYWLYNGGATAEWFTGQKSGTDHSYKISTVVAGTYTDRVTVDTSGNVGIGTASPGAVLQLNKASGAADLRLSVGGTLYTNIYASSSDVNILGVTAIPLILGTNNTERMRIDASGNVGIGASAPATKLEVNGGLIAGSENRQTHPPTGPVGFKAQWNYTGGDGETDLYNLYSTATTSFRFYQTTGSGTAQLLYNMRPTTHEFYTGGTLRFSITSTGGITSSDLADAVGYKGLPQNQQTSTYTLALSDMGKHVYTTAGAFTVTIPANATTAFPIGAAITIVNEDANKTLAPAAGVTLVLAGTGGGTTGNRTLAIGSVVTVLKVGTNRWFVSGAGVT